MTEDKKLRKSIYRVIYDAENRKWLIKKDGADRVIASAHTKELALERVKKLSEKQKLGYVVHKRNGQFQKKNNL